MTHIRRLSAHVRSGNEFDVLLLVHDPVVRNVRAHARIQNRMLAFEHFHAVAGVESGPHIAFLARQFGQRHEHVDSRQSVGARMQIEKIRLDGRQQLLEQLHFQLHFPFLGVEDLFLLLFQFLGYKTGGVGQCLLGHIAEFRLDSFKISVPHFDIVSKHAVVADFQRPHFGPFPFFLFQSDDVVLPLIRDFFHFVQLFGVAGPKHAALF